MLDLVRWLEAHTEVLITEALSELATDDALKRSVGDSILAFYEALAHAARVKSPIPLRAILIDWVESRSAPTDEEPAGLMPVLSTLKRVAWEQIKQTVAPEDAIELLM